MTMEFIDESGKLRSDEDIQEVIDYLTKTMVEIRGTTDPGLVVLIPTVLDVLRELQALRTAIRSKVPNYGR